MRRFAKPMWHASATGGSNPPPSVFADAKRRDCRGLRMAACGHAASSGRGFEADPSATGSSEGGRLWRSAPTGERGKRNPLGDALFFELLACTQYLTHFKMGDSLHLEKEVTHEAGVYQKFP